MSLSFNHPLNHSSFLQPGCLQQHDHSCFSFTTSILYINHYNIPHTHTSFPHQVCLQQYLFTLPLSHPILSLFTLAFYLLSNTFTLCFLFNFLLLSLSSTLITILSSFL